MGYVHINIQSNPHTIINTLTTKALEIKIQIL
jgi:hypothetical protein